MKSISKLERKLESTDESDVSFWQRLKDLYFEPKGIERWQNGKVYEFLGVRCIKKICDKIGDIRYGKKPNHRNNYKIWDATKEGLKAFERETRHNETIHSPITILMIYGAIDSLGKGNYYYAAFDAALVLLNGYCTMLQRYSRVRLYNTIDRIEKRESV